MTQHFDRIKLNVGGAYFETTRSTLRELDSPFLNRMVPKKFRVNNRFQTDNVVFIDRDPECFRTILNLARYNEVFLTEHVTIDMLEKEAEFLKLKESYMDLIANFRKKKEQENEEKTKIVQDVSMCKMKMFESLEELREIKNSLYGDVSDSDLSLRLNGLETNDESEEEPQLLWDD